MENITTTNITVHPSEALNRTLIEMNNLERLSFQKVDFIKFVFKNFYSDCSACVPEKIWNYMNENFTYIQDEKDETITAPYILIKLKQGDCDCFSLFAKTCLDILGGWYSNYLLLGKCKNEFSHIVVFAYRGKNLFKYNDPVCIDGANNIFNVIPEIYKYRKLI